VAISTKEQANMIYSDNRTTYVFLDGDEFLWSGTQELYPTIYSRLFAMMALGIDINHAEALPDSHPILGRAVAFYNGRVGETEFDSYGLMQDEIARTGTKPALALPDYIKSYEDLFGRQYRSFYAPRPGVVGFLRALRKRQNHWIAIVSSNTQYAVEAITDHLQLSQYCDAVHGAPFTCDPSPTPYSKASVVVGTADKQPPANRRVFLGGDGAGDIKAAAKATKRGVKTHSFAVQGTDAARELHNQGAELVVRDLGEHNKIFSFFDKMWRSW